MPRKPTPLPPLIERVEAIARDVLRDEAEREDRDAVWPEKGMRALGEAGLLGLNAPATAGGHGLGIEALVEVSRVLAHENPSAALCYAMHCVGTAVITAKATPDQRERFLEPIAEGSHVTTLALSEPGTGAHFYIPETRLEEDGDDYLVSGVKSFVTNGGRADSYVLSTVGAPRSEIQEGEFSAVVLEAGTEGMTWGEEWRGFGMRGNSSRTVELDRVRIPRKNLLGAEGDEPWYLFEVVIPYFLGAMAGTYLGVAEAAVDLAVEHLGSRRYSHTGETLGGHPTVAGELGEMWVRLESARQLVLAGARRADAGTPESLRGVFASKVAASDAAVELTKDAMRLTGGVGYRENSHLGRLLRDAQASHLMAPTTEMLRTWIGRALLDLPLLQ